MLPALPASCPGLPGESGPGPVISVAVVGSVRSWLPPNITEIRGSARLQVEASAEIAHTVLRVIVCVYRLFFGALISSSLPYIDFHLVLQALRLLEPCQLRVSV